MKQQALLTKIFMVLGVSFIFLLTGQADSEEALLQYKLDTKYSGASPAGSTPWLTAEFDNNDANDKDPNRVLLTMSAHNLTGSESVRMWCFNVNLRSKKLTFAHVSGPVAAEIRQGSRSAAGGGGYFDLQFVFKDDTFNAGESSVYEISYKSPITYSTFSKLSSPGGNRGRYGSAALVNDISGKNKLSGWIGDGGTGSTAASGS